jgi:hypothetical protein
VIVPGHEQLERERVVEDDNERFMLVKKVVLMTTPRSEAFDALLDRIGRRPPQVAERHATRLQP